MMQSTFHAVGDPRSTAIQRRAGLTMLEVIFAMVVILVGLVAVGLLIPLAGRQAADSYQITQGLAAGESAVAMVKASEIIQPSTGSPWCIRDDNAGFSYKTESLQRAYDLLGLSFSPTNDPTIACVYQNRAIGYGFCLDPLFWGEQQPSINDPLPAPFVRSQFPCLKEDFNPASIGDPSPPAYGGSVPRLIRVSAWNPSSVQGAPFAQQADGYLPRPAATRLATLEGGDLVQFSPDVNKALGPLRSVYTSPETVFPIRGNPVAPVLGDPVAPDTPSWMMTLTPSISTPLLPQSVTIQNFIAGVPDSKSNQPVRIPSNYDLAIVVFSKRDVRDINKDMSATAQNLPNSERILRVSDIASEALTSGTFNLTLEGSPYINPRIKIGDWMMLSRWTEEDLPPVSAPPSPPWIRRQIHRWYRVIGIVGEDAFPVSVRVVGTPWNWTENEVSAWYWWANATGQPPGVPRKPINPPGPNSVFLPTGNSSEVHATLLRDVVHVYERQIEL
jgi:hypothetical protein